MPEQMISQRYWKMQKAQRNQLIRTTLTKIAVVFSVITKAEQHRLSLAGVPAPSRHDQDHRCRLAIEMITALSLPAWLCAAAGFGTDRAVLPIARARRWRVAEVRCRCICDIPCRYLRSELLATAERHGDNDVRSRQNRRYRAGALTPGAGFPNASLTNWSKRRCMAAPLAAVKI